MSPPVYGCCPTPSTEKSSTFYVARVSGAIVIPGAESTHTFHRKPIVTMSDEDSHSDHSVADDDEEEYEEMEDTAEGAEQEGMDNEGGAEAEAGETDAEGSGDISDYFIQHGAHREYRVPIGLIQHEAPKNMKVKNGRHIGDMVASRSGKTWDGLMWFHITLIGGENISGEEESAPHVCFDPPDGDAAGTDDSHWLRPIPAKVMEYHIPLWKAAIKDKYAANTDVTKLHQVHEVFAKYKKVLKWTADKLSGQRLDPKTFPVGKGGFVPLAAGLKLKSIRVAPEPVPRSGTGKGETSSHGTKLTSAICKSHKSKGASSVAVDMQSDPYDVTDMPDARVIRIGPVGTTSTYVIDGMIYATLMI